MIKDKNFNSLDRKPKVLVAPLDWGLGHATRCIPVILSLNKQGCEVILAGSKQVKELLQAEFPELKFIDLRGYEVSYSRKKKWFGFKMLSQLPKLYIRIRSENKWLKKVVVQNNISAVISDNRLGLFHHTIPCIYITHQLLIKTGLQFTERAIQKIHYHFINKYTACWIPDLPDKNNLAGDLSHPNKLPKVPTIYCGILSRFNEIIEEINYQYCFLLSGPEPQRTILENIILNELKFCQLKTVIVRGLPEKSTVPRLNNSLVTTFNHLPAVDLENIIAQSKIVIARSGYSTIMDLAKMKKSAVLIPTPGQTEQEYLAAYLSRLGFFSTISQNDFSLSKINKTTNDFSAFTSVKNNIDEIIASFIKTF